MIHARSSDQGRTWTRETIDPGYQEYERPPVIAADPESSYVYVVWFGDTQPDNLAPHFDDAARADIFIRASSDGGTTWGERTMINDDQAPDTNQVHPGVAIGPGGRVDVAWYDYRNMPTEAGNPLDDRGTTDVYYASSSDRGPTFSPNVKVNDRSIDRSIGVCSSPGKTRGTATCERLRRLTEARGRPRHIDRRRHIELGSSGCRCCVRHGVGDGPRLGDHPSHRAASVIVTRPCQLTEAVAAAGSLTV